MSTELMGDPETDTAKRPVNQTTSHSCHTGARDPGWFLFTTPKSQVTESHSRESSLSHSTNTEATVVRVSRVNNWLFRVVVPGGHWSVFPNDWCCWSECRFENLW